MAECLESYFDPEIDWKSHLDNFEIQNDEFLALESFYQGTDDFFINQKASIDDNLNFIAQFKIKVVAGKPGLKVELWAPSEDIENNDEAASVPFGNLEVNQSQKKTTFERSISGKKAHATINCKFLPNLNLDISLPSSYPSEKAPIFKLNCEWLSVSQLSQLCKQLDEIWKENEDMPILFTWVEWLSSNLVEFLDIFTEPSTIIVTPIPMQANNEENEDHRAVSMFIDTDNLIYLFLHHNYIEEAKLFRESTQECLICFDEKYGCDFFRLNKCKHHFCAECMTDMCKMHVKEGTIQLLKCPESECEEHVTFDIMQQCLDDTENERLERLMLQRTLDSMQDVIYCPQCSQPIITEENDTHAMCLVCKIDYCKLCKDKWHSGKCLTQEQKLNDKLEAHNIKEKDLMEMTEAEIRTLFRDSNAIINIKKTAIQNKQDEAILKFPKCPKCHAPVQRSSGCNKMTCLCGCSFCYICTKEIKGYEHFTNNISCNLWTNELNGGIRPPPRVRNQIQVQIERIVDLVPEQRKNIITCTWCKQRILRTENNNHLKCPLCTRSVCFCCKKGIVGNVTDHFKNSKTCKQHGD